MYEFLKTRAWLVAALSVGVVYVLLRVRGLTASCLWFDEVFSVHAAGMDWNQMFSFVAKDIVHPPLSYVLLKLWVSIGGTEVGWLRAFPLVISVVALIPFTLLVKEMKLGYAAALTAFLFLAFNGSLIKYAQEVRMYALLFCLSAFTGWAFFRFFKMGKGFAVLVIVNALLIYTHYFGWFYVVGELVVIAVWQRIKLRRMLLMLGIEIAVFLPWVLFVHSQTEGMSSLVKQNLGWAEAPGYSAIIGFFFDLTEPVYFQASSSDVSTYWPFSVPVLVVCVCLLASLGSQWKGKSADEKSTVLRLALLFLFPVVSALIISIASPISVWGTRHLIVAVGPLTLLLGISINSLQTRMLRTSVAALTVFLFIGSLAADLMRPERQFVWCAWQGFAKSMSAEGPTSVYLYEDLAAYQFWFAKQNPSLDVFLVEDAEAMSEDKAYFLPRGFDDVRKVSEKDISGDEFFVAYSASNFDDTKAPLNRLRQMGYRFYEPQMFDAGNMKSFLVRVKREPQS